MSKIWITEYFDRPSGTGAVPRGLALLASLLALTGLGAPAAVAAPADLISPDTLIASVRWLADDAREGRMTGSPGAEAAARWIADRFREDGLEPGGDGGTFLQHFDAEVGVGFGERNLLTVSGVPGVGVLTMDTDFRPLAFSENGTAEVGVVFAGYGLTVPDLGYDDYAGVDVGGKAVIVLRHEPQQSDTSSAFRKLDPAAHAAIRAKIKNAKSRGAAAILFVNGPGSPEYDDKLITPRWKESVGGSGILALHVKRAVAEKMLSAAGVDLAAWAADVDRKAAPQSKALPEAIGIKAEVTVMKDRRTTANVVGILPGTDSSAGAIVLGAHYDHLGFGNESSLAPSRMGEIHNGADDNASGTASLVELARVIAASPRTKRTLVFAAFSGEEVGLLGSQYFVEKAPPVGLDEMRAMLNMDMVGRPKDGRLLVGGVGTSPSFSGVLERATRGRALKIEPSKGVSSASDHQQFYQKDIPILFFFSGLHEDYHKPSDDWDKIDRSGITEVVRIVCAATLELAGETGDLAFVKTEEEKDPHGSGSGGGFGAYFGSIPDYGAQDRGVKLSGVKEGSPAEKAGVQAGDVIIRFGGKEIVDIYDYTDALKSRRPGDTVDLTVLRAGQEVTLKATLGTRE